MRESIRMRRFGSFIAACLLAGPAFAQVDCNAGMEPIDGVPVHVRLTVKYSDYKPKP